MSASVLLEGHVDDLQADHAPTWRGVWRFAKDKKGVLDFELKKVSQEIPRDLFDFVSFLDPATIAALHQAQSRAGAPVRHKKRRGRPSFAQAAVAAAAVAASTSSTASAALTTTQSAASEALAEDAVEAATAVNASAPASSAQSGDVKEEVCTDADAMDVEAEHEDERETERERDKGPVAVPPTHPLMGLWTGSFMIKSTKGGEERVQETVFFHSTLGAELAPQFRELPPEPQFPYILLKRMDAKPAVPIASGLSPSLSVPGAPAQQTQRESERETQTLESTDASLPLPVVPPSLLPRIPHEDEPFNTNAVSLAFGYTPAALESLYKRVLIGFGRNSIGRFSVAAIFDEATGELRCEKKYMTVKFTIKRGRRSHAEYAMSAANGSAALPVSNAAAALPFSSSSAAAAAAAAASSGIGYQALPLDGLNATLQAAFGDTTTNIATSRAPRTHKPNPQFFASSASLSAVPATGAMPGAALGDGGEFFAASAEPETKRPRRSLSMSKSFAQRFAGTGTAVGVSALLGDAYGAKSPRDASAVKAREKLARRGSWATGNGCGSAAASNAAAAAALAALDAAAVLAAEPNAVLGPRNPDQDDPQCDYREAFLDVDSGEVYEGQWLFGFRHGLGITIYNDGLMYEGMWSKGKEHGKGELMTGDRRAIYSGDWAEGVFHGYGTYAYPNGDVYAGDWREGLRHGHGEYRATSSGCVYVGDWRENKRHGKGSFLWPDGASYEGEWELDGKHGRGVLELACGLRYEGTWNRNIMEGKGVIVFPSGQSYQGTFRNGLRDGRGSVHFAECAVYEGRFREDRFDGHGTIKIERNAPGATAGEVLIPISIQSEMWRIHWRAGFGASSH